ncbi:hypothetical protein [Natronocalculus amylovorans]|uniref:ParB/Sulfiredoxin domain-containing protein n=1 Tax=Natronocalculus amylovorans TaxID=2917812 RepID=A0AAE3K8X3_9EURY|nr:hypothetical protein [Natronocalculus amylovorans]MCL9817481.1 hypothetical protein [Natronocalculus amylovorans]
MNFTENIVNTRKIIGYQLTKFLLEKNNCAPLLPYKLYWISPKKIKNKPVKSPSTSWILPTDIVGGDWDLDTVPFESDVVYRSFEEHFVNNVRWEDTDYYEFMCEQVENSGSYKKIKNKSNLIKRCTHLDQLYNSIKKYGYRPQKQITQNKIESLDTEALLPPERKEITVHVSRNGEFLWSGGAHRLSIVKLLEIDRIPVRIRTRHTEWQKIRDQMYVGNTHGIEQYVNHPDILFQ